MPVRWNVAEVSEALDEMKELLKETEPTLERLQEKISETKETPNLPGYMSEPLGMFAYDIDHTVAKFHNRIGRMREMLPEDNSARRGCEKHKKQLPSGGENQLPLPFVPLKITSF